MKGSIFLVLVAFALLQAAHAQVGKCTFACPDNYAPLCARGSRIPPTTVANDCEYRRLKCNNPAEVFQNPKPGPCA